MRDAVLMLVSAVYVVGLVTWAMYTHMNRMGSVRALDAQYFVIGAPLSIVIGVSVVILVYLHGWLKVWNDYLRRFTGGKLFSWLDVLSLAVLAVAWIVLRRTKRVQVALTAAFLMCTVAVLSPSRSSAALVISTVMGTLFVGAGTVAIVATYVRWAFPRIPHALGGGQPRRAHLDLKVHDLSKELVVRLINQTPPVETAVGIIRSAEVEIIALNDNSAVVRARLDDGTLQLVELRRDSIIAITWK